MQRTRDTLMVGGDELDVLLLTWDDFDEALAAICHDIRAQRIRGRMAPISGIFGVPRGGLPMAVALSHHFGAPLLSAPCPNAIIVDDVYETGVTLAPYLARADLHVITWICKGTPPGRLHADTYIPSDRWIVFPWEDREAATDDARAYRSARSGQRGVPIPPG